MAVILPELVTWVTILAAGVGGVGLGIGLAIGWAMVGGRPGGDGKLGGRGRHL